MCVERFACSERTRSARQLCAIALTISAGKSCVEGMSRGANQHWIRASSRAAQIDLAAAMSLLEWLMKTRRGIARPGPRSLTACRRPPAAQEYDFRIVAPPTGPASLYPSRRKLPIDPLHGFRFDVQPWPGDS